TASLHGRVDGSRTDEPEARGAQTLRKRHGLVRRRAPVGRRHRRRGLGRDVAPEELVQGLAGLSEGDRCTGVRDRGLDLPAVADDAGVAEQPYDVALAEGGDAIGIEPGEGLPERRSLPEDRQPREPRLESLETESLVDAPLVAHRPPPLLVVVAVVPVVG